VKNPELHGIDYCATREENLNKLYNIAGQLDNIIAAEEKSTIDIKNMIVEIETLIEKCCEFRSKINQLVRRFI
jgi:hypothetical protein